MSNGRQTISLRTIRASRRIGTSFDTLSQNSGVARETLRRKTNGTTVTKPSSDFDRWHNDMVEVARRAPCEDFRLEVLACLENVRVMHRNRAGSIGEKVDLICSQFELPDLPKTLNEIIEDSGLTPNDCREVVDAAIRARKILRDTSRKPNLYKLR